MNRFSRRTLLKRGIGYGCMVGGGSMIAWCGALRVPAPVPPVTPTTEPATVAIIRGNDLDRMAREALQAVGGAGTIVHQGDTVFIKPNFGGADMVHHNHIRDGDSTKPDLAIIDGSICCEGNRPHVLPGW